MESEATSARSESERLREEAAAAIEASEALGCHVEQLKAEAATLTPHGVLDELRSQHEALSSEHEALRAAHEDLSTQLAAAREEAAAERRLPSIRAKLRQLRLLPTHSTSSPPRLLAEARDQLLELPALRNEVDERQKALGEVTMRARRARDASLPSPSSLLPSHSPSPYPR